MLRQFRRTGRMGVFTLVWIGQMVSIIGSGLTSFALDIWVYQHTRSVTQFAFASLCTLLPPLLLSPIAGALVDRWNRRWCMILSDSGTGLCVIAIALLVFSNRLEVWHVYIAVAIASTFGAFQSPAYHASIAMLVPKSHLHQANSMIQTGDALAMLLPPVLGGFLLVSLGLPGVIAIDFGTFLFSIVTLLLVRIPDPEPTEDTDRPVSFWAEVVYGWKYIQARPGLMGLMLIFMVGNFVLAIVSQLIAPLVLSFANAGVLGIVYAIDGVGMLLGTLLISMGKTPSRQVSAILGFQMLGGFCLLLTGFQASIPPIALATCLFSFGSTIINISSQYIWQTKVAPNVQGRVFAVERMLGSSLQPFAYILVGPLADRVFEPLMAVDGALASSVGQIIGVGAGRGIGLMFIMMGAMTIVTTVAGYQYPRLRLLEDELADQI
jgi:MFS transporter, DHA3 family, macrolide efflux protein